MINVYCKNNGIIGMIRSICINYIVNLFNLKLYHKINDMFCYMLF